MTTGVVICLLALLFIFLPWRWRSVRRCYLCWQWFPCFQAKQRQGRIYSFIQTFSILKPRIKKKIAFYCHLVVDGEKKAIECNTVVLFCLIQTKISWLKIYAFSFIFLSFLFYYWQFCLLFFLILKQSGTKMIFRLSYISQKREWGEELPVLFCFQFFFLLFLLSFSGFVFSYAFYFVMFFHGQMCAVCPLEGSQASVVVVWQTPSWEQRISCRSRTINGSSM